MSTGVKIISFLLIPFCCLSQVSGVYKTNNLLKRINSPDTLFVVNFWATWCKPCVQELPAFDSLHILMNDPKVKVLLVSLDFIEELNPKVNPFLIRNKIKTECVLLDEVNGNNFINKISKSWSGAIPATFLKKGKRSQLFERKFTYKGIQNVVVQFKK